MANKLFFKKIILAKYIVLILAVLGAHLAAAQAQPRPNILLLIADDWGYPHAEAYGDSVAPTPTFNRLAREGLLYQNAFCAAPSCSPSRAAILTGQYPHQLKEASQLWGSFDKKITTYPQLLEAAGYFVGLTRKGWGPGNFKAGGYEQHNPAGKGYRNFEEFLAQKPEGAPFCFWFGSTDPHRNYEAELKNRRPLRPEKMKVPHYLPDTPQTRADLLDYYAEINRFDEECGQLLALLEQKGLLDNTLVVMTSDNGMPFPRAKANVYEAGAHLPLALYWKNRASGGQAIPDLVNLASLAGLFVQAAGLPQPPEMTLPPLPLATQGKLHRQAVFVERERHADVRAQHHSYPVRAVRTARYLYIRNLRPERWPAGDPQIGSWRYGDVDNSPTKALMLAQETAADSLSRTRFALAFGKRPAEELYDLQNDPHQLRNLANEPTHKGIKKRLARRLNRWMRQSNDPRINAETDVFDHYPYYGKQL